MKVLSGIRVALMVVVLAAAYDYFLLHISDFLTALAWPHWWMSAFPTRSIAAQSWLIGIHTSIVLLAAAPVALASLWLLPTRTALLAALAGLAVAVVEVLPATTPELWRVVWGAHPVFFVTDNLKIIFAMPLLVWLLRRLPSNTGWSGRDLPNTPSDTQRCVAHPES
jgi:hypothetical protein